MRKSIIDSLPKTKSTAVTALIQGQVPLATKKQVEKWLRATQPKKTWNDFVNACCLSFLAEIKERQEK